MSYQTNVRHHYRRTRGGRFVPVRRHQRTVFIVHQYPTIKNISTGDVREVTFATREEAERWAKTHPRTSGVQKKMTAKSFKRTGYKGGKDDFAIVERAAREDAAKIGAWMKKEGAAAKAWWARHKAKKRLQAEQARRERTFGVGVGKKEEREKEGKKSGEGLFG